MLGKKIVFGVLYWLFIFPVFFRLGSMVGGFPLLIYKAATGALPAESAAPWFAFTGLVLFGAVGGVVATWKGHKALMRFLSGDDEPGEPEGNGLPTSEQ